MKRIDRSSTDSRCLPCIVVECLAISGLYFIINCLFIYLSFICTGLLLEVSELVSVIMI